MKIVINSCFGGFGLSEKAKARLEELDHLLKGVYCRDVPRDHPALVKVVEELGNEANGLCAELKIVEVPDDLKNNWHIHEYDGMEHVAENHRTFY